MPRGSTGWRAWSASGWTRCTSPGCAPGPGSRSATCAARTSWWADGCRARGGSPDCRARCWWASGRRGGCGSWAAWAPAGARRSAAERSELAALLAAAATDMCPFDPVPPTPGAHWVLPRLVGEVRYSTRTRAGLLRQPSWLRLRPDLAPEGSAADLPEPPE
ncbi:hypothetical protein [Streptomyces griseorubiginosus]|uniref:ATP dependent DNA ligase n=1 Tax=Streptomyces griseorubiginosus TaxID=67304 RepID=UPI003F53E930